MVKKTRYELRVYGNNGASAQIVRIDGKRYTVIAKATIPAGRRRAILEWQLLNGKKKQSLLEKLKPSRLTVRLGVVTAEWDLEKKSVS